MGVKLYSLAVAVFIFIAMAIIPAIAESSSNEKIAVIIGFKDKPDAALVKAHGGEIKYQYDLIPAIAASLPEQAINGLQNNPNVAYIEEDSEVYISKRPVVQPAQSTPWGVLKIEADKVPYTINGSGVKVAIIDTGIDYMHPDLADNFNEMKGYDFVNADSDPMDDNGHGTHVAGTIAAIDNTIGVVGVAPEAELYSLKVLSRSGRGSTSNVIAAIQWANNTHMDVISMSLGSSSGDSSLNDACQAAYDSGIVIVAAAGNEAGPVIYPAAYDSVIAVSATNSTDGIASFSNYGPQVELAAPGVSIFSTYLGGGYDTLSGTSMATPHVSGVVALLLSANNTLSPVEVRGILNSTATDFGTSGWDEYYGYGLVNASAVIASLSLPSSPTNPGTGDNLVVSDPNVVYDQKLDYKFVWATATVTVTDGETGLPVEGVTVEGIWTVVNDGVSNTYTDSEITDSSGTVVFKSVTLRYPVAPSFSFEVTSTT